jgi:hypothetical protein
LNPSLQAATEQAAETVIDLQKIRKDLGKLKDILHTIADDPRTGDREEE